MASLSRLFTRKPTSRRPSRTSLSATTTATSTFASPPPPPASSSPPPPPPPSLSPLKTIVNGVFHERDLDTLVEKFKKSSESYRFRCKHRVYEVTIRRLASAKRFESIEEILESHKQFSDIKHEGFAIRLISLYGKSGMFVNARKLFDELPELCCSRTVKSFNALLAAALDSKEYETVGELFDQLASQMSVKPDVFSYNILMQSFCKMGNLDAAISNLDTMEKNSVKPNLVTFNTLLNVLYGSKQFQRAEEVWAKMEENACVPDIISYNSKLRGLVSEGRMDEAVKLVDELQDQGLKPDIQTFNSLIKGYCSDGSLEEAKKVFNELMKNDCAPNWSTFETLIPYVLDKEDLELAAKLCKESISRKCKIDVDIVQSVVDALVRDSRIEEAKKLVEVGASKTSYGSKLKLPSEGE